MYSGSWKYSNICYVKLLRIDYVCCVMRMYILCMYIYISFMIYVSIHVCIKIIRTFLLIFDEIYILIMKLEQTAFVEIFVIIEFCRDVSSRFFNF